MKLWTYHAPDFSLTDGCVDPERSQFAKDYPDAYRKLWELLRTDQIIWCNTTDGERQSWFRVDRREWELDVPEDQFVKVVDCMVWNGILKKWVEPPRVRERLIQEGLRTFGSDVPSRDRWYKEQINAMLNPPGNRWDSLFIADPNDDRANVLLRHPIDPCWVQRGGGKG